MVFNPEYLNTLIFTLICLSTCFFKFQALSVQHEKKYLFLCSTVQNNTHFLKRTIGIFKCLTYNIIYVSLLLKFQTI